VSDRKKEPALERPVVGSVEGYHEVWNNLRKVAGRRFPLEYRIGRQKLHAQGTQTAGRQAGAACLPREQ
jgi:hypothetical protein